MSDPGDQSVVAREVGGRDASGIRGFAPFGFRPTFAERKPRTGPGRRLRFGSTGRAVIATQSKTYAYAWRRDNPDKIGFILGGACAESGEEALRRLREHKGFSTSSRRGSSSLPVRSRRPGTSGQRRSTIGWRNTLPRFPAAAIPALIMAALRPLCGGSPSLRLSTHSLEMRDPQAASALSTGASTSTRCVQRLRTAGRSEMLRYGAIRGVMG